MNHRCQMSLDGGFSSIVKDQPPFVMIGSQITLRHTFGQPPCWLHSHEHVYPIKYPDDRGSSHQQQVTCYAFKDVNNWWIVKVNGLYREKETFHPPYWFIMLYRVGNYDRQDPNTESIPEGTKEARVVQHGDVIQLLHGTSRRALNSHDVAAPLTPENQEVSCYIDYNISMPSQNLWRVELEDQGSSGGGGDSRWRAVQSKVRLVHVDTKQTLTATQNVLPDWGFYQVRC